MLYKIVVAALVASASAFSAPVSRVGTPTMQMTDFSWRNTFNGKPPGEFVDAFAGAKGVVVSTAAASPGDMTVGQVSSAAVV